MGAAGLSKHIIGAKGGSEREEKDIVYGDIIKRGRRFSAASALFGLLLMAFD